MRVLVIGGSGFLGGLTLPFFAQQHHVRIFDRRAPADPDWEYVSGDVGDPVALTRAAEGMDALLYMAMGSFHAPRADDLPGMQSRADAFDVNVKGVHLALFAAHRAGITHAVYTSSMSVYQKNGAGRFISDEDLPPDARHWYGFTKHLGEEVCRNAAREWGMSVNALRLCLPMPEDKWRTQVRAGEPNIRTTADDTARALLTALEYRAGFQAFAISGDYEQKLMSLAKAKRLLGWEPLARPDE